MTNYLKKLIFNLYAILGRLYIAKNKPIVIWVTGSVGKTSCRVIVTQILEEFLKDKKIYTSPKNYNSELGIVFSIYKFENYNNNLKSLIWIYFKLIKKLIFSKKEYDILVLEYWIDKPKDMEFLLSIVKPDYSIFTKLDLVHLEFFNSKEDIWKEKWKLIQNTKRKAFINFQDLFQKDNSKDLKIYWEFYNKSKNIEYKYTIKDAKINSLIKYRDNLVRTNIFWEENFYYIELSFRILKELGVEFIPREASLKLKIQPWRFDLYNWINWSVLIDSSYNSCPESMFKMIENTKKLRKDIFKDYKMLFVIWDMRELWEKTNTEHKKLYTYLKSHWEIISIWKETKNNFWKHLKNFKYSKDAWKFLKEYLKEQSEKYLILFKWSQNTIFVEEALKEVLNDYTNIDKLVRQDKFWLDKKNKYFESN